MSFYVCVSVCVNQVTTAAEHPSSASFLWHGTFNIVMKLKKHNLNIKNSNTGWCLDKESRVRKRERRLRYGGVAKKVQHTLSGWRGAIQRTEQKVFWNWEKAWVLREEWRFATRIKINNFTPKHCVGEPAKNRRQKEPAKSNCDRKRYIVWKQLISWQRLLIGGVNRSSMCVEKTVSGRALCQLRLGREAEGKKIFFKLCRKSWVPSNFPGKNFKDIILKKAKAFILKEVVRAHKWTTNLCSLWPCSAPNLLTWSSVNRTRRQNFITGGGVCDRQQGFNHLGCSWHHLSLLEHRFSPGEMAQ